MPRRRSLGMRELVGSRYGLSPEGRAVKLDVPNKNMTERQLAARMWDEFRAAQEYDDFFSKTFEEVGTHMQNLWLRISRLSRLRDRRPTRREQLTEEAVTQIGNWVARLLTICPGCGRQVRDMRRSLVHPLRSPFRWHLKCVVRCFDVDSMMLRECRASSRKKNVKKCR